MIKEAVCHKMDKEFVYAIEKGKYVIKLRTKKDDVTSVYLAFCDKYLNKRGDEEGTIYQSQMHKSFSDELFDYYEIILDSTALCVRYFFILKDDKEVTYYGNYHFFSEPISDLDYMFDFSTAVKDDELFIVLRGPKVVSFIKYLLIVSHVIKVKLMNHGMNYQF